MTTDRARFAHALGAIALVLLGAACTEGDPATAESTPSPSPGLTATDAVVRPSRLLALHTDEGDAALPVVRPQPQVAAGIATPVAPAARPASSTPSGAASGAARVVDRGRADRRFIALSFDAGADVGYTTLILDTLRANGVIASFGITGHWSEQNPALLRRIVSDGHHLINHTYDHGSFTGFSTKTAPLSAEARHRQLDRTAEAVRAIAGVEIGDYFRPPYGDYDASVNVDVGARGYRFNVMWTVDSLGWNGLAAPAIVERCLARAAPGAIYIFHVGSQSQDALALPAILEGLRGQGYALGSVRTLLEG